MNKRKLISLFLAANTFLVGCGVNKTNNNDNKKEPEEVVKVQESITPDINNNEDIIIIPPQEQEDNEIVVEETPNIKLKDIDTIAIEVINGLWKNGDERKNLLTQNGYDYDEVMKRVNEILKEDNSNTQLPSPSVTPSLPSSYSVSAAYINSNTPFYDENGNYLFELETYDKVYVTDNYSNNNRFIYTPYGYQGYVNNNSLTLLPGTYIEVDISDQKVYMYIDNEKVFEADVITGNPNVGTNPGTDLGYTEIYYKNYETYLVGPTWKSYVDIFMCFNTSGEGFHDADGWRSDSEYDNKSAYLTNGSHGCVNMKQADADELDSLSETGTKVLIHR